jgi:opacity protein-like surface antigen
MKKTFLLIAFLSAAFLNKSNAQGFEQGKTFVSVGIGAPYLIGSFFSAYQSESGYSTSITYPMYLKGEIAISENVGIGVSLAYAGVDVNYSHTNYGSSSSVNSTYKDNINYKTASGLVRFSYHFIKESKIDPYIGLGLGYRWGQWKYSSTDPSYTFSASKVYFPFGMDMTLGCRYMFSDNIGAYAEMGIAKSPFQFGATFRF